MVLGNLFQKFKSGLSRTAEFFGSGLRSLFGRRLDKDTIKQLEALLLRADVGFQGTARILERLQQVYAEKPIDSEVMAFIKSEMKAMLQTEQSGLHLQPEGTTVIMVVGVNGAGKTTSIAKLATWLQSQGKSVLLGAGDTFRAAAVEQLDRWAQRTGADIIKGQPNSDPASVAFNAVQTGVARKRDIVIVDTAGRLHTQTHLMRELEKIHRVIGKAQAGAPHEVLQVLDATNGQNAIQQATKFTQVVQCTGIILAKMDGTAKGGAVLAIREQVGLPVKFVGLGEKAEDLAPFDPDLFIEGLFSQD